MPLPIFRSTSMPAIAALETFLRSMSEMPYMAPKAGMSLQSTAWRRRAETLGSIENGASFLNEESGVAKPFSFSQFSRWVMPSSLKVMFFAMLGWEGVKPQRWKYPNEKQIRKIMVKPGDDHCYTCAASACFRGGILRCASLHVYYCHAAARMQLSKKLQLGSYRQPKEARHQRQSMRAVHSGLLQASATKWYFHDTEIAKGGDDRSQCTWGACQAQSVGRWKWDVWGKFAGKRSWSLGRCLGPRQLQVSYRCSEWMGKVRSSGRRRWASKSSS